MNPQEIKNRIDERIKLLSHNTIVDRKNIYNIFKGEFPEDCDLIEKIANEVERHYSAFGWKNIAAAIFAIGAICNVVEMITKPLSLGIIIPLAYLFIGVITVIICIYALYRGVSQEQSLDAKWAIFIGLFTASLGCASLFYSHLFFSEKEPSLKDILQAISEVNDTKALGIPEARYAALKESVDSANLERAFDQNIPGKLNDDFCTVYISSFLGTYFLWNNTLSSDIFANDRPLKSNYRVISATNKSLRQVSISDENGVLFGDFGVISISPHGKYEYKLTRAYGFGNFEEFEIKAINETGLAASQKLYISLVNYTQSGTESRDTLFGTVSGNQINGNDGGDWLFGNRGVDFINGGNGDDLIGGYGGNDHLTGGSGNDTIYGGEGNDVITGDSGNDFVMGDDGNDINLSGGDGDDVIYGGNGDDNIDGGDGNDALIGGDGTNIIKGGTGSDVFWVTKIGSSYDKLLDFKLEEGDKIDLSKVIPRNEQEPDLRKILMGQPSSEGYILLIKNPQTAEYRAFILLKNFYANLDDIIQHKSIIY